MEVSFPGTFVPRNFRSLTFIHSACAPDMPAPTAETEGRSFAGLARELQCNPVILKKLAMKPAIKPVVGASLANKHVKAVTTSWIVNIFVSRLHPETKSAELIDSVHSVKGELKVQDIVRNSTLNLRACTALIMLQYMLTLLT